MRNRRGLLTLGWVVLILFVLDLLGYAVTAPLFGLGETAPWLLVVVLVVLGVLSGRAIERVSMRRLVRCNAEARQQTHAFSTGRSRGDIRGRS